ncbi:MAG: BppU family phage baseplate upper protein [Candidatus Peregrinibacteria bacterium]
MQAILDYSAPSVPIVLTKGDNEAFDLEFTESDGTASNLTGYTLSFVILKNADYSILLTKNMTISSPTTGIATLLLSDTDWTAIGNNECRYYVLQTDPSGNKTTQMGGTITLNIRGK